MSNTQTSPERATRMPIATTVDLKLEVVVIPVSDVDRAKRFYEGLGWRLDADFAAGENWRVVQFTPPGSPCSIHFGKGLTTATPGSFKNLYLVVSDMEAARAELNGRGAGVSEAFHFTAFGGPPAPVPTRSTSTEPSRSAIPTATAGCCRDQDAAARREGWRRVLLTELLRRRATHGSTNPRPETSLVGMACRLSSRANRGAPEDAAKAGARNVEGARR